MPGWRMGFAVGNERLIGALTRIKSYLDYGAFTPIQVAASAALDSPVIRDIRNVYKERRDVLIDVFSRAGWDVPSPQATMFAWARIPPLFEGMTSLEFSSFFCRKPISRCRRALTVSMATIMCVFRLKMNSAPVRQAETCGGLWKSIRKNGRPHERVAVIGLAGLGTVGIEVAGRLLHGRCPV